MAKRATFGQTWWGEQFLNALTSIDYSNRLPRGRTYANNGSVKDFGVSNNSISAKVQGSQRTPYKQTISLVPFTKDEKEVIIDAISNDMGVLAELLNRQMPKDLDAILTRKGIQLFPKNWKSLSMRCSCPDSAVPCKHLAAVVYLMSNEVDKNPFILFELRGFALLDELKNRGILDENDKGQQSYITFSQFVMDTKSPIVKGTISPESFEELSFAINTNGLNNLLQLLDENTLFYQQGSFKDVLQKIYKQTARYHSKEETGELDIDLHRRLVAADNLSLELDENGYFENIIINKNQAVANTWVTESEQKRPSNLLNNKQDKFLILIGLLKTTTSEQLWHYPNEWVGLYSIFRFAENLVATSNFMPRLLQNNQGFRIQWIPADINAEVKKQQAALVEFCPGNLLNWTDKQVDSYYFNPTEQLRAIVDVFLGYWIRKSSIDLAYGLRGSNANVFACFVDRLGVKFKGLGEAEIPASIQLWLQRFYLQHKRFVPMLQIEEHRNGFMLQLKVEDREDMDKLPIDWKDFLSDNQYSKHKMSMIQDVQMLSKYLPELSELLKTPPTLKLYYEDAAFEKLFFDILPVMELLGVTILLPKSLRKILFPQLSMSISKDSNETGPSFMALTDMLSFDWKIAIGDRMLTPEEFKALVAQKSGLVKIQNEYVQIRKEDLQKMLKQLESAPKVRPQEVMQAAMSGKFNGATVLVSNQVQQALDALREIKEVPLPQHLLASLRPYQLSGYSWLYKNAQLGMGSILADDMGLGKTLQVITLLLKFKEEGLLDKQKALIVVPTSLLTNWEKEVEKFAPLLQVAVYHGPKRSIPETFDLLVTSYGVLRSDEKILKKYKWHLMAIDEAQAIKNVTTVQSKAVKSMKASIFIAMSGTPVENRLSEYWSIMDFTNKGYLGTLTKFTTEFAKPIQLDHDQESLDIFRKITTPFILRRLKSDKSIIKDLPDKIVKDHYVNLEKEQAAVYENLVKNTIKSIESAQGITRQGLVLTLMGGLKQICNHPTQFLKKGNNHPDMSGKAKAMLDLLDTIQAEQEKVLIFTQYTQTGSMMVEWIKERYGREPLFLQGKSSRKQRDAMVEAFQHNRQDNIFVLSLKAGGTGLNLTAANHVIHYDLWWNPAVEAQATDRAYRIGQKKNVMVYRLICEGTLEEKIDNMIRSKKELSDMTVTTGETWLGDLTNDDLKELVRLNTLG